MNIPQIYRGTLASTTLDLSTTNLKTPFTISLISVDASRSIQLSVSDGAHYFAAVTPDLTDAGSIAYYTRFPVSNVKITGIVGDTYQIMD